MNFIFKQKPHKKHSIHMFIVINNSVYLIFFLFVVKSTITKKSDKMTPVDRKKKKQSHNKLLKLNHSRLIIIFNRKGICRIF